MKFLDRSVDVLIAYAKRTPYEHLTNYMNRYFLIKPRRFKDYNFQVRVHEILTSDNDRHYHDHPFNSISLILKGGYWEYTPKDQAQPAARDERDFRATWRGPGSIIFRKATDRHRLQLRPGIVTTTIFAFAGKHRDWGFHAPSGWIFWKNYSSGNA